MKLVRFEFLFRINKVQLKARFPHGLAAPAERHGGLGGRVGHRLLKDSYPAIQTVRAAPSINLKPEQFDNHSSGYL